MSWDFHMHKIGLEVYVHRIILSSTIETYMSGSYLYLYVVSSEGGCQSYMRRVFLYTDSGPPQNNNPTHPVRRGAYCFVDI